MAKNEEKLNKKEVKETKVKKHFFKDFKAELKKVIWPTPKQLVNNTTAVIVIVLITSAIVFILNVAFESINKYGITNLQEIVQEKFSDDEDETVNNDEETAESEGESEEQNVEVQEVPAEETNSTENNSNATE